MVLDGLVVRPELASNQMERDRAEATPPGGGEGTGGGTVIPPGGGEPPPRTPVIRRFHGSKRLDPTRLGRDASDVAETVVQHLGLVPGASVRVTLEIEVDFENEAPSDAVLRTVSENCNTLKFQDAGFEKE